MSKSNHDLQLLVLRSRLRSDYILINADSPELEPLLFIFTIMELTYLVDGGESRD